MAINILEYLLKKSVVRWICPYPILYVYMPILILLILIYMLPLGGPGLEINFILFYLLFYSICSNEI